MVKTNKNILDSPFNKKYYILMGKTQKGESIYFKSYSEKDKGIYLTKKYKNAMRFNSVKEAVLISEQKYFETFIKNIVSESLRVLEVSENVMVTNSIKI